MKITQSIRNIVNRFDEEAEIILFGSRARGDNNKDSDWDFLILLNGPVNEHVKRSIRDELFELELSTNQIISSVIENKKKWSNYKVTPFYKNVSREGQRI